MREFAVVLVSLSGVRYNDCVNKKRPGGSGRRDARRARLAFIV